MSARIPSWAGWVVRAVLTLAVTYFLFRSLRLSWGELSGQELGRWRPRPLQLAASLALLLAVFMYLVALWTRMVHVLGGPTLRFGAAVRVFFLANLGRYMPGKLWQLAGLTYLAGREGVPLHVASSAAILGQLYSLAAAACVAALGIAAGVKVGGYPTSELWMSAAVMTIAILMLVTLPSILRSILRLGFRLARSPDKPPDIDSWFGLRWIGLYLPAWLGYGLAFGILWSSFASLPAVNWPAAVGSFAGAYFLGYAAVFAPAGLGVREGAMAVLMAPWLGAAAAAVLAVMARLWITAGELVPVMWVALSGGLTWLRRSPENRDHA